MKLSVLDQSPSISGHTAADAIGATLELAQAAETLGYQRYWLAEHHGLLSLADPQPEADLYAQAVDVRRVQMAYGINAPIASIEEARTRAAHFSERDRMVVERQRPRAIIGTPDLVAGRIAALAELFAADEVVVLSVAPDYGVRLKSSELLSRNISSVA